MLARKDMVREKIDVPALHKLLAIGRTKKKLRDRSISI
jgi:hypothetical protein